MESLFVLPSQENCARSRRIQKVHRAVSGPIVEGCLVGGQLIWNELLALSDRGALPNEYHRPGMNTGIQPWQLFIVTVAGWVNRHQQTVIDYLLFGTTIARRHRALPSVGAEVPMRDVSGRATVHFERRRVALRSWIDSPWASKLFSELHLTTVRVLG